MRQGFIKVAALTPKVKVADTTYNREQICMLIDEAQEKGAKILVFPELCITGYTCGDLFYQELLLREAKKELLAIAKYTERKDCLVFVGLPLEHQGKLYNVAAAIAQGKVLGLVPKTHIPNYNEFYERRHFVSGMKQPVPVALDEDIIVPMGTQILFQCRQIPALKIAAEICEDVWAPNPPGVDHALAGATVLVNLSASDETTGKDIYRKSLVTGQSGRLICGYIYCSAGDGESTQDVVYSGHNLIAENGSLLAESRRFCNESIYTELDIKRIVGERRKNTTFTMEKEKVLPRISFPLDVCETKLTREFPKKPFVPQDEKERALRCEEILTIQAMGLKKRLLHTHANTAVVGISGGLDSTLALIVTAKAFDMIGKDKKEILAITMPCFGTTDRTYRNACKMAEQLGATLREVKIADSVSLHFQDIGHDPKDHSVTYENAQARERTQVLMDIANATNGMVIGTGDMSELALGWATYNGDHMSMYGVNASVPKTLVRHLVKYAADVTADPKLQEVLYDVLDTPVSPELLPPKDGDIAQKTEDLVGPYELHDFYLYFMLRFGYEPGKIYRLAVQTFEGVYEKETILKWLTTFCRRFFNQQFKRSCLPDGPKIGTVALSPRGDWRMPSDACAQVWMRDLEKISL